MLKKVSSSQVILKLRVNPETPEAIAICYCRHHPIGTANQMLQRAINAFYLPLAYLKQGSSHLQVERVATAAIYELLAQVRSIETDCLPNIQGGGSKLELSSYNAQMHLVASKEVFLTLIADEDSDDALVLDYCQHQRGSTNELIRTAIRAFYLPLATFELGKTQLQVERVATAAIREIQAQIRLLQRTCLSTISLDVSIADSSSLPVPIKVDTLSQIETLIPPVTTHTNSTKEIALLTQDSLLLNYVGGISSADLAARADPFQ
ncbi:MAG: hypothetical protein CLLPBCKN_007203 [Chroococcidiopsis cubana SAG 39.79]|uniref:Baseplate protein J-like domain-containing protein n=1 Tax=Chroococcidiopsis cubana SAG 39.79 TaxID=388085 RepID=A0AB37URH1_9CYAN|nr:hypothetical protein [Chroococcidiopsis cubana]MDZ4877768.1 hypothetical protein [Chroococcidiopsis cubana SAG 39.79]PSB62047.1 hypothetical protein C7B79_19590 [Chroococcidiopsis cubana CCALA 043]RUT14050.1 hypothetical protein DSM107010_05330 [Chroococcidiopsis cubana SAG 39.79]